MDFVNDISDAIASLDKKKYHSGLIAKPLAVYYGAPSLTVFAQDFEAFNTELEKIRETNNRPLCLYYRGHNGSKTQLQRGCEQIGKIINNQHMDKLVLIQVQIGITFVPKTKSMIIVDLTKVKQTFQHLKSEEIIKYPLVGTKYGHYYSYGQYENQCNGVVMHTGVYNPLIHCVRPIQRTMISTCYLMGLTDIDNERLHADTCINNIKRVLTSYSWHKQLIENDHIPLRFELSTIYTEFMGTDDFENKLMAIGTEYAELIKQQDLLYVATNIEYKNYVEKVTEHIEQLHDVIDTISLPLTKLSISKLFNAENKLTNLLQGFSGGRKSNHYSKDNPQILEKLSAKDINRKLITIPFTTKFLLHLYNDVLPDEKWDQVISSRPKTFATDSEITKVECLFHFFTAYGLTYCRRQNGTKRLPKQITPSIHLSSKYLSRNSESWTHSFPIFIDDLVDHILEPANVAGKIILNNCYTTQEQQSIETRNEIKKYIIDAEIQEFPTSVLWKRTNVNTVYSCYWSEISTEPINKPTTIVGELKSIRNLRQYGKNSKLQTSSSSRNQ